MHGEVGVFLDRDGVINSVDFDYFGPKDSVAPYEFEYRSGVVSGIKALRSGGFKVFVVTNKPCISMGLNTYENEVEIARRIIRDTRVDGYFICPHGRDEGCTCRKPEIGWLVEAAVRHHVDLGASWVVGDKESDILFGKLVGAKTIIMDYPYNRDIVADFRVYDFEHATEVIVSHAESSVFCQGELSGAVSGMEHVVESGSVDGCVGAKLDDELRDSGLDFQGGISDDAAV